MLETAIYVRVSTEEQAQEGFSIRAQQQKLSDYVQIKDWSLYKIYADEGISGKNIAERPAINEMIGDIKKGHVKNVLVFKIDRLTRNTADLISLVDLFNTYDCAFNSLTESIDTQSATGRMFIKIIGIFAEFERENIAERSRFGFERKAREGYSMCTLVPSYGYDRNTGEKVQRINAEEARIVKSVFDMFLNQNMSYLDIARALNVQGISTKLGSTWHARTVKNVLTNCNYAGKIRYATKDEKRYFEAQGIHEPIISDAVYEETQSRIQRMSTKVYKKHPKENHYYAGFLTCGVCGERLVVHGDYKKDENGASIPGSYRCRNRHKKTCTASDISHIKAEEAFIEYIARIEDFDAIDGVQLEEKQSAKQEVLERAKGFQRELSRLESKEKELVNLYISSKLDFDSYMEVKTAIAKEKTQISSMIEKAESLLDEGAAIRQEDVIRGLKENWCLLTNAEKRQFLMNFVERIAIINEKPGGRRSGTVKIQAVEFVQ